MAFSWNSRFSNSSKRIVNSLASALDKWETSISRKAANLSALDVIQIYYRNDVLLRFYNIYQKEV